jgi:hypothetical protein
MYKQPEILNINDHKNKVLKEVSNFSHAKELISAPIGFNEFYEACRDYPILFAKDPENNWFATTLLGVNNKNLYIDDDGNWKAGAYIPAFVRRYPFVLVKLDENSDELTLAFDHNCSEDLNESNKANAFFNEDNTPSELSQKAMNFLLELNGAAKATSDLIKDLEGWGLLEEKSASIVDKNGNTHNINGFFTVNEEKLDHLSEKKKSDICKMGALPLIIAHLISLGNIRRFGV